MVRLKIGNKAKKTKSPGSSAPTKEETVSLVVNTTANNGNGTLKSPTSSPSSTTSPSATGLDAGLSNRVKQLIYLILLGCFALFVWDSLEWDDQTGDMQLKLIKGNKQQNNNNNTGLTAAEEIILSDDSTADDSSSSEPATKDTFDDSNVDPNCKQQCKKPPNPKKSQFGGVDMTLAKNMLAKVETEWQNWIDNTLKIDYGEYYQKIFEPEEERKDPVTNVTLKQRVHVGNQRIFKDPFDLELPGWVKPQADEDITNYKGEGWKRMIRKYKIKLLQVQLGIAQERINAKSYCSDQCGRNQHDPNKFPPGIYSRFIWTNGGHSASAGHGNFYRESYTANVGRDLQPILKAIGLDFQVRNYAMGGTESSEEVALCFNSIFGRDVDHFSWDYGMTDGRQFYKMFLYAYRGARLALLEDSLSQPGNVRHRPSFFAIHIGKEHPEILQHMQIHGMTNLAMDMDYMDVVKKAIPNMFGMTDEQIAKVPPLVRYFKCSEEQTGIESGDPGCKENKYNNTMCEQRQAKASWHPGWKYHALIGHLMSVTILQVVTDTLKDLMRLEPAKESLEQRHKRIQQQLQNLDAAEQADYEKIFNTPVPDRVLKHFNEALWNQKGEQQQIDRALMKNMSMEMLIKDPTFCHTAMLPAEIRYKGLLTQNPKLIGTAENQVYEFGVKQKVIEQSEKFAQPPEVYIGNRSRDDDRMIIGMKDSEHQDWCADQLNVDFKDYFFVSSIEDWRWVRLPNQAEQAYYTEFDAKKSNGWILICMAKCDWGNCPQGDIRQSIMTFTPDEVFGGIEMEVNLVKVTSMSCMNMCCALKHSRHPDNDKQFVWEANEAGRYDFRARITGGSQWGYARFSSFIVL